MNYELGIANYELQIVNKEQGTTFTILFDILPF